MVKRRQGEREGWNNGQKNTGKSPVRMRFGPPNLWLASQVVKLFDRFNPEVISTSRKGPVYLAALDVYEYITGRAVENIGQGCAMVRPVETA